MAAMTIANTCKSQTIGQLKKFLEELEAEWTEEDRMYLGEFDHQAIYTLGPEGGVARAFLVYDACFGLMTIAEDRHNNLQSSRL